MKPVLLCYHLTGDKGSRILFTAMRLGLYNAAPGAERGTGGGAGLPPVRPCPREGLSNAL